MNLTYSIKLDRKTLVGAEIDQLFDEIEVAVNSGQVEPHNVSFGAIDYRVLSRPPKFALGADFGYPVPLTTGALTAGYYPIQETKLLHDSTHTEANNRDVLHQGVTHVLAIVSALDSSYSNSATRLCIGVSTDAGATWTPIATETSRPLGESCGKAVRVYNTPEQTHYITGAAGYKPFNQNFDRPIVLVASFGGEVANTASANVNAFCIMADANTFSFTSTPLLKGVFFLNARERGF